MLTCIVITKGQVFETLLCFEPWSGASCVLSPSIVQSFKLGPTTITILKIRKLGQKDINAFSKITQYLTVWI